MAQKRVSKLNENGSLQESHRLRSIRRETTAGFGTLWRPGVMIIGRELPERGRKSHA